MLLSKGTVLKNKWTVQSLVGKGGMASVYAAKHRNGSLVAIKVLNLEVSQQLETRERFLREGYVANAVEHPGVVRVFDDDVLEDGSVFLVMELLEGEALDVYWKRNGRRLPELEVLSIIHDVLDVLVAAHEKGIVHRDIKPSNIFKTKSGAIKVLDFGIARLHEGPSSAQLTTTGAFMGTPSYVPPEQARGRSDLIDRRSDLWSVAATTYVLLTGKTVHSGGTMNELLLAAMTCPAQPIALLRPDLLPSIQSIVDRGLEFERDARWPDARTMQMAVQAAMHAISLAPLANSAGHETIALPTHVMPQRDVKLPSMAPTVELPQEPSIAPVSILDPSQSSTSSMGSSTGRRVPAAPAEIPLDQEVGPGTHRGPLRGAGVMWGAIGMLGTVGLGASAFWWGTNHAAGRGSLPVSESIVVPLQTTAVSSLKGERDSVPANQAASAQSGDIAVAKPAIMPTSLPGKSSSEKTIQIAGSASAIATNVPAPVVSVASAPGVPIATSAPVVVEAPASVQEKPIPPIVESAQRSPPPPPPRSLPPRVENPFDDE